MRLGPNRAGIFGLLQPIADSIKMMTKEDIIPDAADRMIFILAPAVVAALLTIIGYSLNDTIVVFDRIRENMKLRRKESYREVINRSINECLSRTVLTSLTTFFVAATLYFFGGPVIHDFAFALCFGVMVGTYSSMFIASPILVWWYERRIQDKKRMATDM